MYPDGTYENRPTTCWTTQHGNARYLRSEIRSTSISCHKPIRTQQFSNTKASKTSLIAILQASKSAWSWNRSCSDFHNARKGANYTLHAMFMLSIKDTGSRGFSVRETERLEHLQEIIGSELHVCQHWKAPQRSINLMHQSLPMGIKLIKRAIIWADSFDLDLH